MPPAERLHPTDDPVGLSRRADILVSLSDELPENISEYGPTQQRLLNLLKKKRSLARRADRLRLTQS